MQTSPSSTTGRVIGQSRERTDTPPRQDKASASQATPRSRKATGAGEDTDTSPSLDNGKKKKRTPRTRKATGAGQVRQPENAMAPCHLLQIAQIVQQVVQQNNNLPLVQAPVPPSAAGHGLTPNNDMAWPPYQNFVQSKPLHSLTGILSINFNNFY